MAQQGKVRKFPNDKVPGYSNRKYPKKSRRVASKWAWDVQEDSTMDYARIIREKG
jgi:hypothetical protein